MAMSSILTHLEFKDDYDNLRGVSRSMWKNMEDFKTDRLRFQSLFLPDVCAQHLKEGVLDACTRYLSTTSFSVLFFGSSGLTGKQRAERLMGLAEICASENDRLLALVIQKLPSTQLVNMINEYYVSKKVINPRLFSRAADTRPLIGKTNISNRDKVFELLLSDLKQHATNFSECEAQIKSATRSLLKYLDNHSKYGVSDLLFERLLTVPMIENAVVTDNWIQAANNLQQALDHAEKQAWEHHAWAMARAR